MGKRNEPGLLIARILVGLVFVVMGVFKLTDIEQVAAFLGGLPNFPAPGAMAWIVPLVEIVGGLALILGIKPRTAACGMAIYIALATPVHLWDYIEHENAAQITNILKNIGILGGLVALWAAPSTKNNLLP